MTTMRAVLWMWVLTTACRRSGTVHVPARAAATLPAETLDPSDRLAAGDTESEELRALFREWWDACRCAKADSLGIIRGADCDHSANQRCASTDTLRRLKSDGEEIRPRLTASRDRWYLASFLGVLDSQLVALDTDIPAYSKRMSEAGLPILDPEGLHISAMNRLRAEQLALVELFQGEPHLVNFESVRDAIRSEDQGFPTPQAAAEAALEVIALSHSATSGVFEGAPATKCKPGLGRDWVGFYEPSEIVAHAGIWWIDTSEDGGLPRYALRPQGFHECWPGHHMQIAALRARTDWPRFRRLSSTSAYMEGWATYAEQHVAVDLGLYHDRDELGLALYRVWREARVVVDTGRNAMGWSDAQVQAFLMAETAIPVGHIDVEVERITKWPALLMCHALGLRAFEDARVEAEAILGSGFDSSEFNSFLFEVGPLPLPDLRPVVVSWANGTSVDFLGPRRTSSE